MSFGYSVDDVLALIQLSWSAVEGATRACGKHDDLTKEVLSLYDVLAHFYSELSVAEPSFASARSSWKAELQSHLTGCDTQLRIINTVLDKFNALSYEQKIGRQLWSKIRFANGEDQDVADIRSRMGTYSTAITMMLRLISSGSRGKIERQLSRQKGLLEGIRESVNLALAHINSTTRHKSLIIGYSNDAKAFWSCLRRELTKDGFSRSALNDKKDLILSYMKELDSKGVLGYSTSFQKAMNARNECNRQSSTPASFQSSSSLTGGRSSNFSFQSFGHRKDSGYCSSAFDEPVCMRTDSEPSWLDYRPVATVEHEENIQFNPNMPGLEPDQQCIESSIISIPYRVRREADSTLGSRTLDNEPTMIPTQNIPVHSSLNHESITNLSGHRSNYETEQNIRLEDPHGREFSFPLSQAKSWEGMASLIKKNCAGMGSGMVNAQHDGTSLFPYVWEQTAEPGTKLTIRHPCKSFSQPSVSCTPSEEFYLLPERPLSLEDDFSHLPTLGDWIQDGRTEFTPHSEFYEVD